MATFTTTGKILTGPFAGSTDLSNAQVGNQIQIDVFATYAGPGIGGATFAIGNPNKPGITGFQFDGGLTSSTWFHESSGKFGQPIDGLDTFGGIDNGDDGVYSSIAIPRTLSAADISLRGNVLFFVGFTPGPFPSGSGALDIGILDGAVSPFGGTPDVDVVSNGAAHARLLFTLTGAGDVLQIGASPIDDSLTEVDPGPQMLNPFPVVGTISALPIHVPEPGGIGLGWGIAALAVGRIRRTTLNRIRRGYHSGSEICDGER